MSLNKNASSYTPKWLQTSTPPPQPQPAADTSAPAPAPAGKLSGTARSFVPRFARSVPDQHVDPVAAPAPVAPVAAPAPNRDLQGGAPPAVQGAWSKRSAVAAVAQAPSSKASTPAVKPVTPMSKPVTPGSKPSTPGQKYRPPEKKMTEAMIAAQAAQLKKDAPSFIPKRAVPPMTMITPPVTPPVKPAPAPSGEDGSIAPDALMPLNRKWSLYYVDRAPQGTTAYDPMLVYEIKSVEDFWRTVNNVPSLTNSNMGSTYYFFRDGIQPKWEDPGNAGGGSWTFRMFTSRDLTSEAVDEIWERLMSRAIGESWPDVLANNLIGVVAKMRDRCTTIQFWVSRCEERFAQEVVDMIGDLYKSFKLEYLSHQKAKEAADERDKELERTRKADAKKNKKNKRTY